MWRLTIPRGPQIVRFQSAYRVLPTCNRRLKPSLYKWTSVRSNSTDSKDEDKDKDKNVPASSGSNDIENYSPDMSSRVSKPKGSLPSIDPKLAHMMQGPKVEYDPNDNKDEKTYEYHMPKSPDEKARERAKEKARGGSKLKRMMPSIIAGSLFIWGAYTYKYMTQDSSERDDDGALLREDKFLPYLVSFKYQIDDDHYLIELTRRNRGQKLIHNQRLFDGSNLWSIEIAKPDINIVRNYTPLPLFVAGVNPETKEPNLRMVSKGEQEGKLVLIVKRYPDGEFSRWLTGLEILSQVQVRGPIREYKVPFHPLDRYPPRPQLGNTLVTTPPDPEWPAKIPAPENFVFYGAGSGVLPALQLLYSPNPPKGFTDVYISMRNRSELLPQIETLNYFAEKCGRAKFHYFFSDEGQRLSESDIKRPTLPNFSGVNDLKISEEAYRQRLLEQKKAEVRKQVRGDDGPATTTSTSPSYDDYDIPIIDVPHTKADNAYQQFNFLRRKKDQTAPPSFAFVCGPDGYITAVSGKPDLNNTDLVDKAPIEGLLKKKGWSDVNVKRLVG